MLPLTSTQPSYWTRFKDCLYSEQTLANSKIAFWTAASMGAVSIPLPYLRGVITQAAAFMALQEILKHPDSALLQNSETFRQIVATRNWKHLALGAAISAVGGVLGDLSLASKVRALFLFPTLASLVFGLKVTYSPTLFVENADRQAATPSHLPDAEHLLSHPH